MYSAGAIASVAQFAPAEYRERGCRHALSSAPMAARCTDNGVHFTGARAGKVDAVFFAKAFQP